MRVSFYFRQALPDVTLRLAREVRGPNGQPVSVRGDRILDCRFQPARGLLASPSPSPSAPPLLQGFVQYLNAQDIVAFALGVRAPGGRPPRLRLGSFERTGMQGETFFVAFVDIQS